MKIRDYQPNDLPAVVDLVSTALAEHGFVGETAAVELDLIENAALYTGARGRLWVAEIDHALAGTVAIRPKEGDTCELKRLYLRPGLRGSGLGQALYEHAEAFARAAGYSRIWMVSSRRFAKAHRLYERNGFVVIERLDNDWEDNLFEKQLTKGAIETK